MGSDCRLVPDTNVFVAASFEPKSASARLLEALCDGRCEMAWHRTTRRETERVLRRIPPLDWQPFAPLFQPEWEHMAELDLAPFAAIDDPDDRKFAALAAATDSVLISGDDHLLARRDALPVRVLRPSSSSPAVADHRQSNHAAIALISRRTAPRGRRDHAP